MVKLEEQKKAINLRRKGFSYREILQHIPVAKSTLSLWLRKVGLSKRQKQRLTLKKLEAGKRGAQAQRNKRLKLTKEIKEKAKAETAGFLIDKRSLWLMGIMLYWAEGAKEKDYSRAAGVKFGNSDPFMIKFFQKWLLEICKISKNDLKYELYVHENNKYRLGEIKKFWNTILELKTANLRHIYFKKHRVDTKRKNTGKGYYGLINIVVCRSTFLNRKIAGWIEGLSQNYCRVV